MCEYVCNCNIYYGYYVSMKMDYRSTCYDWVWGVGWSSVSMGVGVSV